MEFKNLYIVFILIISGCHNYEKKECERIRTLNIGNGVLLNAEIDSMNNKLFYTSIDNRIHGTYFQYNELNKIEKKQIYFLGSLLQEKKYFWKGHQLDSIIYSFYEYNEKTYKHISLIYPMDDIFFQMKYSPIVGYDSSSYEVSVIGDGGIASSINFDYLLSQSEIEQSWDKMKFAENHLTFVNLAIESQNVFHKQMILILKYDSNGYLKRYWPVVVHYVPIFTDNEVMVNLFCNTKIYF